MAIEYEWILEEICIDADIVDVLHYDSYAHAHMNSHAFDRIALVMTSGSRCESKAWAYVFAGHLEENFLDSGGAPVRKVPMRFRKEVAARENPKH